ncbi:MAG TPA: methionyl-tRNA formyltransferase, partial [Pyrinomonadaceae bacterium]|nr:methionyl-tRNA formyltransferase [Pyrinomonadaceae bacterium]
VNWAIVRGERVTGVTTMLIDEGLDTGPVLLQRPTEIGDGETAPRLLERLSHEGAELLSQTLARLDEIEPRPQRDEDATLAPMLRREDGLIDWTLAAADIERRVRGFQPWPNAHTLYGDRRLVVWRASPATLKANDEDASPSRPPGEVMEARGDSLAVACGDRTSLRIQELQLEGKQRVSARDFINGTRLRAGERFG